MVEIKNITNNSRFLLAKLVKPGETVITEDEQKIRYAERSKGIFSVSENKKKKEKTYKGDE